MSISTIVFIADSKMIGPREWAEAIRANGFAVQLHTEFDVRSFTGFLPCQYKGLDAGFEYFYEPVDGLGALNQQVRDVIGGRDRAVSFVTHSDFRELMTSILSAGVLCAVTDGVLWDTEADELIAADDVVARSREAEQEIAKYIK